jgi:uncharacterized metal-binding protein YceD (DUF177 family)
MLPKSDIRPRPHSAGAKPEARRFARMLAVETVPDRGLDMQISASETERALLAAQSGVVSVQSFEAGFHVRKQGGMGRFHVRGQLQARVTQMCGVSLEPFESEVTAIIDVAFAPPGRAATEPPLSEDDPPDPIMDGQIDLGALAAEFLVLNLNPYPRKPGAVFQEADAGSKAEKQDSPFSVLLRR